MNTSWISWPDRTPGMATFKEFLDILKQETEKVVRAEWRDCQETALNDGQTFVEKTRADLVQAVQNYEGDRSWRRKPDLMKPTPKKA